MRSFTYDHVFEPDSTNAEVFDACARDLSGLTENQAGLTDLLEMGFADTALNAKLFLKNGFSVKNTVRDLVSDA